MVKIQKGLILEVHKIYLEYIVEKVIKPPVNYISYLNFFLLFYVLFFSPIIKSGPYFHDILSCLRSKCSEHNNIGITSPSTRSDFFLYINPLFSDKKHPYKVLSSYGHLTLFFELDNAGCLPESGKIQLRTVHPDTASLSAYLYGQMSPLQPDDPEDCHYSSYPQSFSQLSVFMGKTHIKNEDKTDLPVSSLEPVWFIENILTNSASIPSYKIKESLECQSIQDMPFRRIQFNDPRTYPVFPIVLTYSNMKDISPEFNLENTQTGIIQHCNTPALIKKYPGLKLLTIALTRDCQCCAFSLITDTSRILGICPGLFQFIQCRTGGKS